MFSKQQKIEQLLKATPRIIPPVGLLERLKAGVDQHLPVREKPQGRLMSFPPLRRMAYVAGISLLVLFPLAYAVERIYEKVFVVQQDKMEYRGFMVGQSVGVDAPDKATAKRKFEEFKQLYNEGKAREVKPGIYAATLSDGEEFRFNGDPNKRGRFDQQFIEQKKKEIDEMIELKKSGSVEKVYVPRAGYMTVALQGEPTHYIENNYILPSGKLAGTGAGDELTEAEVAGVFKEVENLRKEGMYLKIYKPINIYLEDPGNVLYETYRRLRLNSALPGDNLKRIKSRYFESTFLLADGRLFTIGEYEPVEMNDAAFKEIAKLRAAGHGKKVYHTEKNLKLQNGWNRYVEVTYTLANGEEVIVAEYETEAK